jgi:hypothetical protein
MQNYSKGDSSSAMSAILAACLIALFVLGLATFRKADRAEHMIREANMRFAERRYNDDRFNDDNSQTSGALDMLSAADGAPDQNKVGASPAHGAANNSEDNNISGTSVTPAKSPDGKDQAGDKDQMDKRLINKDAAKYVLTHPEPDKKAQIYSLADVRGFFAAGNIGGDEAKKHSETSYGLYPTEGWAGISMYLSSYNYMHAYYKNIVAHWDKMRSDHPGIVLSDSDAELVAKFAFIGKDDYYKNYPDAQDGRRPDGV